MPAPTSIDSYLKSLPEDKRASVETIRKFFRQHIETGFEEGLQYGMIGYYVPHSRYPKGYHCDPKQPLPFAHIAARSHGYSLYLFCIYGQEDSSSVMQFVADWKAEGKKLDMGKACVRVKTTGDIAWNALGKLLARITVSNFIEHYEGLTGQGAKAKPAKKKKPAETSSKATPKRKVAKASAKKKVSTRK